MGVGLRVGPEASKSMASREAAREVVGAAVVLHKGESLDLMALRSFTLKRGMMKQWWPETMVAAICCTSKLTGSEA